MSVVRGKPGKQKMEAMECAHGKINSTTFEEVEKNIKKIISKDWENSDFLK